MRRGRAGVALVAVTALSLAACGGDGGGDSDGPLQLYNDKGAWKSYFEDMGELSEEETGLSMEPVGYTDAATYDALVRASLQAGEKPDLFTWHTGGKLTEIVETGKVATSSELWDEAIANGDLSEELREHYTIEGEQYCVPLNIAYWVMFYNKEVFDAAGLSEPESWADLMAAADTLAAQGVTPLYATADLFSFAWFQQLLVGSDPELYAALTRGEASFTDPGVVEVMQLWKSLFDQGYMSDPGVQTDPETLLGAGDVAMMPFGTFFNTSMTGAGHEPGTDYGMFVIPNVNPDLDQTTVLFESGPLCTLTEADNPEASAEFSQWWLTTEAQDQWANSRGDVSANPHVEIPDPDLDRINQQAGSGELALANRFFEAFPAPVVTAGLDAFGAFTVDPGSYQAQLENLEQASQDYWSRAGE